MEDNKERSNSHAIHSTGIFFLQKLGTNYSNLYKVMHVTTLVYTNAKSAVCMIFICLPAVSANSKGNSIIYDSNASDCQNYRLFGSK